MKRSIIYLALLVLLAACAGTDTRLSSPPEANIEALAGTCPAYTVIYSLNSGGTNALDDGVIPEFAQIGEATSWHHEGNFWDPADFPMQVTLDFGMSCSLSEIEYHVGEIRNISSAAMTLEFSENNATWTAATALTLPSDAFGAKVTQTLSDTARYVRLSFASDAAQFDLSELAFTGKGIAPKPDTPKDIEVVSYESIVAKARELGVSPLQAAIPNAEEYYGDQASAVLGTLDVPTGASSVEDFTNKLFASGTWNYPQEKLPTPGNEGVDASTGCLATTYEATYNPEDLVFAGREPATLYPGGLVQGQAISLGLGGLSSILIESGRRNPVHLTSTLYESITASEGTASSVNTAVGDLIKRATDKGLVGTSQVAVDVQTASSIEEALTKFKLDAKLLGGSLQAKFDLKTSTQESTVFVKATQSLFEIQQDLQGPFFSNDTQTGMFNSTLSVADLERVGASNEIAYDNLPTYVSSVLFGRVLIFSITSSASETDLELAVNAKYNNVSADLTQSQKEILNSSKFNVYSYGGAYEAQAGTIKSGDWKEFFAIDNETAFNSLAPLGYQFRDWQNKPVKALRTTEYTELDCSIPRKIEMELTDTYRQATVYLTPTDGTEVEIAKTLEAGKDDFEEGERVNLARQDITANLDGDTNIVRVEIKSGDPSGIFKRVRRYGNIEVFVDDISVLKEGGACIACNSSSEAFVLQINRLTGKVELLKKDF